MSAKSTIEWTMATWNPTLGCSKKSPGCKNCYAMRQVYRMSFNPNPKIAAANAGLTVIQGGQINWTGKINFIHARLSIPLRTKKPTTYFVNSLSDLFHENLAVRDIDAVFAVMSQSPQHIFQVLTKEADRMREYLTSERTPDGINEAAGRFGWCHANVDGRWPLPNVWLGVSVENQQFADERVPLLLDTPAAVRFVSYEPAVGPVTFTNIQRLGFSALHPSTPRRIKLDWIISGGESGPGARPAPPEWFRSIRDQCAVAGVSYFHKQNGNWSVSGDASRAKYQDVPVGDGTHHRLFNVGKKAAGALLDGREWRQFPEVANA